MCLTYFLQTCNCVEFGMTCWTREEDAGEAYHYIQFRPLTPGSLSSLLGALQQGEEAQISRLGIEGKWPLLQGNLPSFGKSWVSGALDCTCVLPWRAYYSTWVSCLVAQGIATWTGADCCLSQRQLFELIS